MSSVTGLLGVGGGAGGTSFNVQSPVSSQQANGAYTGVQNSLASQQALLGALQSQNGIQNQNQVYGQLQGVANGTGPNPAQAMLNQATGQNVSNQAALMAGQRGASSNVGLIARQAAQQGAQTQQQAVGQDASLQAQQSLNAIGAAGNLATTQAGQQIGQTNANTQAQSNEQQNLLNSIAGVNSVNGQLANTQLQGQQGLIGGLLNAGGAAAGLAKAEGGEVTPSYADGGSISSDSSAGPKSSIGKQLFNMGQVQSNTPSQGPFNMAPNQSVQSLQSGTANFANGIGKLFSSAPGAPAPTGATGTGVMGDFAASPGMAKGGMVNVMLSPGEVKLSPKQVAEVKKGADPMKVGTVVPGHAAVGGAVNSYANDKVKDKAKPGTIIVPRSETQSNNPNGNSKRFVDATLAKRKARK